jgi:hypothetical protein
LLGLMTAICIPPPVSVGLSLRVGRGLLGRVAHSPTLLRTRQCAHWAGHRAR